MRPFWKSRLLGRLITAFGFFVPLIVISVAFFISAKVSSLAPLHGKSAEQMLQQSEIPLFGKNLNLNTILFMFIVFGVKSLWLLVAMNGAGSISLDRKNFALPLYFSRPLSMRDYMTGKVLGIALFPTGLLLGCLSIIALQAWAYFLSWQEFAAAIPMIFGCIITVLIFGFGTAISMVAFSSMTKKSGTAIVTFVGFWIFTGALSLALEHNTDNPFFGAVSLARSMNVIGIHLIQPQAHWLDQPMYSDFGFGAALASLLGYSILFTWILRRNLKVVEIVQ
jgi:hypothetical protein